MEEILRLDLNGVNAYLVKGSGGFVLFDCGGPMLMDQEAFLTRREPLLALLEQHGCKKGALKLLVLTHGDCDHAYNAAWLQKEYGAKVLLHERDRKLLEHLEVEDYLASLNYRVPQLNAMKENMKEQIEFIAKRTAGHMEACHADILLSKGEAYPYSLKPYGIRAEIVPTPGHTNGSIGICFENGDFISGDTFANGNGPEAAVNALDFTVLEESIQKIKQLPVKRVFPGHGEPFLLSEVK